MALENINIDFQIIRTGDPNIMILCDTSQWAHIKDSPATMEITLPSEKVIVHHIAKNQNNVLNTSNLYISPYGKFYTLPDGIYKITVKGSPDDYSKTRYVIRDEKLQLDVDKLFLNNFDKKDEKINSVIDDVNKMMEGSRAAMRRGEKALAVKYYKEAKSIFENYEQCKDCD